MKSSKWIGWFTVLFLFGIFYPVTVQASTSQARIARLFNLYQEFMTDRYSVNFIYQKPLQITEW
jgi:hypothetical protein